MDGPLQAYFLHFKGKGVSLSRSFVLDFTYSDKNKFVSYAGR